MGLGAEREVYLVALGGDNLLNDQMVGGLVVHCENERGAMCLHVSGLAVCQTAAILHAAGCACTSSAQKSLLG